jgi:hypothetical protein
MEQGEAGYSNAAISFLFTIASISELISVSPTSQETPLNNLGIFRRVGA